MVKPVQDHREHETRAKPEIRRDVDILVIGGGVVGTCAAYYLAETGRHVTLVDKTTINAGSSYGNAGLTGPCLSVPMAAPGVPLKGLKWMLSPESPFYIKPRLNADLIAWLWNFFWASRHHRMARSLPVLRALSALSAELFEDLCCHQGIACHRARRGVLMVCRTAHALDESKEQAALLAEHGVPSQALDRDGIAALLPFTADDVIGGIYFSHGAHLDPALFVEGVAQAAASRGVDIWPSTEVLGFKVDGRQVCRVTTTRGDIAAQEIVLASGAWSPEVAASLGLRLPMQPAKGYSITVRAPEDFPNLGMILTEAKVAIARMGDFVRFAGTLELCGMDLSINQRRVDAITKATHLYLPKMPSTELVEIWRSVRPCTPDGLPYVGRAPALDNVVVAAGHGMIGLSTGPGTGKTVAQMVAGQTPEVELSLLDPTRYG